jgi:23S rRNA (cytosine1962-C5)-methyltransferase
LLDAIAAMPLPTDACRIFHGRGGLHPGCEPWTLDAYPPVFVLTSFAPASDGQLAAIGGALQARWADLAPGRPLDWVFQQRGEAQRLQGRPDTRLMVGSVPDPHVVTEAGVRFRRACAARPEPRPVPRHGRGPPLGAHGLPAGAGLTC